MEFTNLGAVSQLSPSPSMPQTSGAGASSILLALPLLLGSITNSSAVPSISQNTTYNIVNSSNDRLPQIFWGFMRRPRNNETGFNETSTESTENDLLTTTEMWETSTIETTTMGEETTTAETTTTGDETTTVETTTMEASTESTVDRTSMTSPTGPQPAASTENVRLHPNCGLTITQLQTERRNIQERIVGGLPTTIDNVPWQVSLQRTNNGFFFSPFCGGSVIHPQWVLTAAHCLSWIENSTSTSSSGKSFTGGWYPGFYSLVYQNPLTRLRIRAGTSNLLSTPTSQRFGGRFRRQSNNFVDIIPFFERSVSRVLLHPNYTAGQPFNDVALIELSRPLPLYPFSRINSICLPSSTTGPGTNDQFPQTGSEAIVSGWGRTAEDGNSTTILRSVNVTIVQEAVCQRVYGNNYNSSQMLCAGDAGRDSCQGDSGGPLFQAQPSTSSSSSSGSLSEQRTNQYGIVSYGFGCGRPNFPGIYSRISNYVPWIVDSVTNGQ